MAINATFTANFASFYDAVDKATVKLKDIESGADKVGKRLDGMVESFSGKKIIQEAMLMEKAIGGVEGIASLTEKEIARLGNTTNEAVAKMKKLGIEVPPGIQAIADKTKQADKNATDWIGTLGKFATAAGIAFSVDAIRGFIVGLFEMAGHIQDVSDKLGVSTDAVQGWSFAAEQTGASMDDIGRAVIAMSRNISGGDASAVAALTELHLKFSDIEDMQPEEAFNAIAAAIKNVPDPMDQARIAMELFGKSGVELLPAIRQGMVDIAEQAPKMSAATIKAMDDFADVTGEVWAQVKVLAAELTVLGMNAIDPARKLGKDLTNAANDLAEASAAAGGSIKTKLTASLTAGTGPAKSATAALAEYDKTAAATKITTDKAAAAVAAHNRALQDMADQLTGKDLARKVADLGAAVDKAGGFAKVTAFEQEKLIKTIVDMWKEGAKLPPVLEEIFAKYGAIHVVLPYLSTDIGLVTRQFENQAPAVVELGKKYYDLDQNIQWLDGHVQKVGNTMNLPGGVDWKKWEPPPTVHSEWEGFGKHVEDIARGMSSDFAASIVDMATGAVGFHDGFLRIWDSIKQGVRQILADMLSTFINEYIKGLIGGFARSAGAITAGSVATGAGSSAGGIGVGAAGGIGVGGAVAGAAVVPAAALIGWMAWQGFTHIGRESYDYTNPDQDSGIVGLANAQAMADYLGVNSNAFQDLLREHPEFIGHGNGFARGTHGYMNFGTGTPVTLHGYEKVVPKGSAEDSGWGGAPTIINNIDARGASFDTPDSLRRLADRVSDALTAKYKLSGKLRPAM